MSKIAKTALLATIGASLIIGATTTASASRPSGGVTAIPGGVYVKGDKDLTFRTNGMSLEVKSNNNNLVIKRIEAIGTPMGAKCIDWMHDSGKDKPHYKVGKNNIIKGKPLPSAQSLGVVQPNGWKIRSGDVLMFKGYCIDGMIHKVNITLGNGTQKKFTLTKNDRSASTREGGELLEKNVW